ncbi:MAG: hypothetical protein H0A76_02335 [Candidatus Thiodubiliella endoseptemdiera]|uniref:Uncharacterized protein n=1 Tax=Candidatus Thiodubiliella endoseptemdiera TaxID=2738886 RepID=A0A853EZT0_9GAMM|nr:hypothetical protein [Candidatus Thiodubiliella endoseptemdiera]
MKKSVVIAMLFSTIGVQAMTEQAFVERLKEVHPFFKQQALSTDIKKIEKQATTANEDWIISINSTYQSEKNAKDAAAIYDSLDTALIGISTTKKHAATGSEITIEHTWVKRIKTLIVIAISFLWIIATHCYAIKMVLMTVSAVMWRKLLLLKIN